MINDQNEEYIVGRTNAVPGSKEEMLTLNVHGQPMYDSAEQFANIIIRNDKMKQYELKILLVWN